MEQLQPDSVQRLKRKVYNGLAVAALLLITISYFYFQSTEVFIDSSQAVQDSQRRLAQLESVLSLLKDAETGERGYIITRDPVFLAPYNRANQELPNEMIVLEKLLASEPVTRQSFEVLQKMVSREIGFWRRNVAMVHSGRVEEAVVRVPAGKKQLDAIRAQVASMQQREREFLRQMALQAQKNVTYNRTVNVIGVSATVLLFLIGVTTIIRDINYRAQAERKLRQLNQDLDASNEELRATNEELNTTIEELQTANEKIRHTSDLLERRNWELENVNQELETFSYSVSHDLRTPLQAVIGFAGLLGQEYAPRLDQEATRLISIIEVNATRMARLIERLLEFARLGRTSLQKDWVPMQKMVQEIVRELQKQKAEIPYYVDIHPLPKVWADQQLMKQVWVNLLSNAFKFAARAQPPMIEVGYEEEEYSFRFYVKDNGVGYDPQYAADLFGVFKRLHSEREFEGTGVGLAIVHRIITYHGGTVGSKASPNQGAIFYFTLPKYV